MLIAHRTLREASLTQGLGDPVSRPRKMKIKACTGSNVRVDYVRSMCEAGGGRRAASKEQRGMLGCEDRDDAIGWDQYAVRSAVSRLAFSAYSPGRDPRPGPGRRGTVNRDSRARAGSGSVPGLARARGAVCAGR